MMKAETKEGAPITKHRPKRGDVALVKVTMEKVGSKPASCSADCHGNYNSQTLA
jgi:hypothetical protein